MPSTYDSISTTTLGTATPSVVFSSIPSTYTDLVVVINGGITNTGDIWLRFNGDTTAVYSRNRMYGNGTTITGDRNTAFNSILVSTGTSGLTMTTIININNYGNTTTFKNAFSKYVSGSYVAISSGAWYNATIAAITSVTLQADAADTFTSGTTFTMYGIKAA
jgi:hypothetical protein